LTKPETRVLLVDDSEDSYILTRAHLNDVRERKFRIDWVSSYAAGLEAIRQRVHDVYLVDYRLGSESGLDLIREAIAAGCTAPLILMTAEGSTKVDMEALEAGAADYLDKSELNPRTLERMIRHALDRKRAEARVRQLEEQYAHSQKMEAVGKLAGGIAHDFNNILTAIQGHAQFVLEDVGEDHPLAIEVREIARAADRAASLTHQLLAFSRKQVLRPRALDVNVVVGAVERMLRRVIGENIRLVTQLDAALASVIADPHQLEQVVVHLGVNARDAMPNGGTLTIRTRNLTADDDFVQRHPDIGVGDYVLLSVTDTGHGMDRETLAQAFDPFFTTKGVGKGSGLGLSSVYGIVKQSGGTVWGESEVGVGTGFFLCLPQTPDEPQPDVPRSEPQDQHVGFETVLVVEDEDAVRGLVVRALRRAGYSVLETGDPREALRIAGEYQGDLDLLLTDIMMPYMNGRVLAEHVAKMRPEIRILLMSGYSQEAVSSGGFLDSGFTLLEKPFTPAELVARVSERLRLPLEPVKALKQW
jgi:two-component system cell cycle sensor histidine kinase/response regulator CckA